MTIPADHPIQRASLDELNERALSALRASMPNMLRWVERMRPADGTPGRFKWALETTRDANVASTSYILGGLKSMGLLDEVITDEDRAAGAEWIESMAVGDGHYRDPALYNRKTPGWPADERWPSPGMLNGLTQYARGVLGTYRGADQPLPPDTPPPGWPQLEDAQNDPNGVLDWIRSRPWDTNPWGAGSHAMRMARWMLDWHKDGKVGLDPLIDALKFFYELHDPETGLYGLPDIPTNVRINGVFKVFWLTRVRLDLPLPMADTIIDQVMGELYRPDYDDHVGGCDELDNWFVIYHALGEARVDRRDEIQRMAAHRIARSLGIFAKPDGGLSYSPDECCTNWIGFDMAPAIPQGDAMGPGVIVAAMKICIELAGLTDSSPWPQGELYPTRGQDPEDLRQEIIERLGL